MKHTMGVHKTLENNLFLKKNLSRLSQTRKKMSAQNMCHAITTDGICLSLPQPSSDVVTSRNQRHRIPVEK